MTRTNVSYRFSWEPASWGQSIKALFRTPPPVTTWFADLERFDIAAFAKVREKGSPRLLLNEEEPPIEDSCTVFHKSIAYLAKYSNTQLEGILVKKFEQISYAEGLKNVFHSILLLTLRTNRPKMLEVCQKVLSSKKLTELFKVQNVIALAQKEALIVQKPQHRVASISKSLIHALQQPLLKVQKVIRYISSTTSQAYGVNFDDPPINSQRAQGQWTFYRDTLHDACVIVPIIKTFFTVQWKTSIVTATLLAVSIAAAYQLSESPAHHISRFRSLELPLRLQGSDDVQQCHTPHGSLPKREPSAELESYLQVLERQLLHLNSDREITIELCNKERESNPDWITSTQGEKLFDVIKNIDRAIRDHKKRIIEARKLSLRLEKLSQIRLDLSQKEHTIIHLLNDQSKKMSTSNDQSKNTNPSFERPQKDYLFLKYLVLPQIRREYDTIIGKCQAMMFPPRTGSRIPRGRASSTSNLDSNLQTSTSAPPALTSLVLPIILTKSIQPNGQ